MTGLLPDKITTGWSSISGSLRLSIKTQLEKVKASNGRWSDMMGKKFKSEQLRACTTDLNNWSIKQNKNQGRKRRQIKKKNPLLFSFIAELTTGQLLLMERFLTSDNGLLLRTCPVGHVALRDSRAAKRVVRGRSSSKARPRRLSQAW